MFGSVNGYISEFMIIKKKSQISWREHDIGNYEGKQTGNKKIDRFQ